MISVIATFIHPSLFQGLIIVHANRQPKKPNTREGASLLLLGICIWMRKEPVFGNRHHQPPAGVTKPHCPTLCCLCSAQSAHYLFLESTCASTRREIHGHHQSNRGRIYFSDIHLTKKQEAAACWTSIRTLRRPGGEGTSGSAPGDLR